mgnify:CR=1 FL=1
MEEKNSRIFVDSNYFVALFNSNDALHENASKIAKKIDLQNPILVISNFELSWSLYKASGRSLKIRLILYISVYQSQIDLLGGLIKMENVEFSIWLREGVDVDSVKDGLEKLALARSRLILWTYKSFNAEYWRDLATIVILFMVYKYLNRCLFSFDYE